MSSDAAPNVEQLFHPQIFFMGRFFLPISNVKRRILEDCSGSFHEIRKAEEAIGFLEKNDAGVFIYHVTATQDLPKLIDAMKLYERWISVRKMHFFVITRSQHTNQVRTVLSKFSYIDILPSSVDAYTLFNLVVTAIEKISGLDRSLFMKSDDASQSNLGEASSLYHFKGSRQTKAKTEEAATPISSAPKSAPPKADPPTHFMSQMDSFSNQLKSDIQRQTEAAADSNSRLFAPTSFQDLFRPISDTTMIVERVQKAIKDKKMFTLADLDLSRRIPIRFEFLSEETARMVTTSPPGVELQFMMESIRIDPKKLLLVNFDLSSGRIFFGVSDFACDSGGVRIGLPSIIYEVQRRLYRRVVIDDYVSVSAKLVKSERTLWGRLAEISLGGFSFSVPSESLSVSRYDRLSEIEFQIREFKLKINSAEIRNIRDAFNQPGYTVIGIKYLDISSDTKKMVQEIVNGES